MSRTSRFASGDAFSRLSAKQPVETKLKILEPPHVARPSHEPTYSRPDHVEAACREPAKLHEGTEHKCKTTRTRDGGYHPRDTPNKSESLIGHIRGSKIQPPRISLGVSLNMPMRNVFFAFLDCRHLGQYGDYPDRIDAIERQHAVLLGHDKEYKGRLVDKMAMRHGVVLPEFKLYKPHTPATTTFKTRIVAHLIATIQGDTFTHVETAFIRQKEGCRENYPVVFTVDYQQNCVHRVEKYYNDSGSSSDMWRILKISLLATEEAQLFEWYQSKLSAPFDFWGHCCLYTWPHDNHGKYFCTKLVTEALQSIGKLVEYRPHEMRVRAFYDLLTMMNATEVSSFYAEVGKKSSSLL